MPFQEEKSAWPSAALIVLLVAIYAIIWIAALLPEWECGSKCQVIADGSTGVYTNDDGMENCTCR